MRTITAQYATSRCKTCGGGILKDSEALYDDETKRIYHNYPKCRPQEQPEIVTSPSAHLFAQQLGYIEHTEAMAANWVLRCVRSDGGSLAVGRPDPAPHQRQDGNLLGG